MAGDKKSVFISVGQTYREEYVKLLDHLVEILESNDLKPRVIDKTDPTISRPIDNIVDVMSECSGAIILVFERKFFARGKEKRKSPSEYDLSNISMTTPWSQIETALAHQRDLPILILIEEGIHREGLIDFGYDWYLQHFKAGEDPLGRPDVQKRVSEWAKAVQKTEARSMPIAKISDDVPISQIIGLLSLKTALQIVALAALIFSAGLALGRELPNLVSKAVEAPK